jgi:uncharacterized Ntn-hydrolase superfamily protein
VAVQAFAPLAWGDLALDRVAAGAAPVEVVAEFQHRPEAAQAQLALVDASGRVAGFTGASCEPETGLAFGAMCCCAANLMERPAVPEAVVDAYEASAGQLFGERLVDALAAGDRLGGDLRGRQAAAVSVVAPPRSPTAVDVDLRVDDHRDPVAELRRLLVLHRAAELVASSLDANGHYREVEPLLKAVALAPDDLASVSALGLALLRAGRVDEAIPLLTHLATLEPRTLMRLQRLVDTGHLDEQTGSVALARLRDVDPQRDG